MDSSTLFGISTVAYIVAMIIYVIYLAFRNAQVGVAATTVTVIGFVAQTFAILFRWREFYEVGQMGILRAAPFTNLYESLVFFVWCLILGYLVVEFKYKNRSFGAFVTPIAGMALALIDLTGMSKDIQPLVPALRSNWLTVHVITSFLGWVDHVSFGEITGRSGAFTWDVPVDRVEAGLGYSPWRRVLLKAAYQYNWRDGGRVREKGLVGAQVSVWY